MGGLTILAPLEILTASGVLPLKLLKIELKDDQALSIATLLIKEAESLRSTWEGDGSDRARMFRDEADDLELLARLIFHKGKYSGFENYKEQILKVYSNS